jgi:hypothetical protein
MLPRKTYVAKPGGELGSEVREHAESRLQRLAAGEVVGVACLPAERFPFRLLDTREIDAALLERIQGGEREVAPHHAHDLHGVENGPRDAEEHG